MLEAIQSFDKEDSVGSLIEHAYILSKQILDLRLPDDLSLATKEQSEKSLAVINELKQKIATYKKIADILNNEIKCSDFEVESYSSH